MATGTWAFGAYSEKNLDDYPPSGDWQRVCWNLLNNKQYTIPFTVRADGCSVPASDFEYAYPQPGKSCAEGGGSKTATMIETCATEIQGCPCKNRLYSQGEAVQGYFDALPTEQRVVPACETVTTSTSTTTTTTTTVAALESDDDDFFDDDGGNDESGAVDTTPTTSSSTTETSSSSTRETSKQGDAGGEQTTTSATTVITKTTTAVPAAITTTPPSGVEEEDDWGYADDQTTATTTTTTTMPTSTTARGGPPRSIGVGVGVGATETSSTPIIITATTAATAATAARVYPTNTGTGLNGVNSSSSNGAADGAAAGGVHAPSTNSTGDTESESLGGGSIAVISMVILAAIAVAVGGWLYYCKGGYSSSTRDIPRTGSGITAVQGVAYKNPACLKLTPSAMQVPASLQRVPVHLTPNVMYAPASSGRTTVELTPNVLYAPASAAGDSIIYAIPMDDTSTGVGTAGACRGYLANTVYASPAEPGTYGSVVYVHADEVGAGTGAGDAGAGAGAGGVSGAGGRNGSDHSGNCNNHYDAGVLQHRGGGGSGGGGSRSSGKGNRFEDSSA